MEKQKRLAHLITIYSDAKAKMAVAKATKNNRALTTSEDLMKTMKEKLYVEFGVEL